MARARFVWVCLAGLLAGGCSLLHKSSGAGDSGEGDGASASAGEGSGGRGSPSGAGPEAPRPAIGGRCEAGEVAILLAPGEEGCVIACKSNAGCPAGWVCEGEGERSSGGKPEGAVRFCRPAAHVESRDGGAPPHAGPAADAGRAVGAADAGGKSSGPPAGASPDAGRSGPAPEAKRLDVKPTGGHCPAGYKTCGAICRLGCASDADCELSTARCLSGFCLGPGAKPCGK